MTEELQNLRIEIDKIAKCAVVTHFGVDCQQKLYYAKAWIGKMCYYLGSESPYKNDGKRKTVEDIEPTDAKFSGVSEIFDGFNKMTDVEKVDFLRQEIQNKIDFVATLAPSYVKEAREGAICRTNAYTYLCEARFALGFYLEFLRENKYSLGA